MDQKITLILGGVRSGKSRYAEELAAQRADRVLFVATAEPGDAEMRARIAAHQRDRPPAWGLLEAPLRVGRRLAGQLSGVDTVILDCVTLLVANVLTAAPAGVAAGSDPEVDPSEAVRLEIEELLQVVRRHTVNCLIVSNEVGLGIVPDNALARLYRDALGMANQLLAREADEVLFMVAGMPLKVKEFRSQESE